MKHEAEVTLSDFRADSETIDKMRIGDLPVAIMPFLLPARFVPFDRLGAFAE